MIPESPSMTLNVDQWFETSINSHSLNETHLPANMAAKMLLEWRKEDRVNGIHPLGCKANSVAPNSNNNNNNNINHHTNQTTNNAGHSRALYRGACVTTVRDSDIPSKKQLHTLTCSMIYSIPHLANQAYPPKHHAHTN